MQFTDTSLTTGGKAKKEKIASDVTIESLNAKTNSKKIDLLTVNSIMDNTTTATVLVAQRQRPGGLTSRIFLHSESTDLDYEVGSTITYQQFNIGGPMTCVNQELLIENVITIEGDEFESTNDTGLAEKHRLWSIHSEAS